jgi:hypothetical protein
MRSSLRFTSERPRLKLIKEGNICVSPYKSLNLSTAAMISNIYIRDDSGKLELCQSDVQAIFSYLLVSIGRGLVKLGYPNLEVADMIVKYCPNLQILEINEDEGFDVKEEGRKFEV